MRTEGGIRMDLPMTIGGVFELRPAPLTRPPVRLGDIVIPVMVRLVPNRMSFGTHWGAGMVPVSLARISCLEGDAP